MWTKLFLCMFWYNQIVHTTLSFPPLSRLLYRAALYLVTVMQCLMEDWWRNASATV